MSEETLADRTALVTGGARRIGEAIAIRLAEAGSDVLVHHNTSAKQAQATAERVRKIGSRAATLQADLSEPGAAQALIAAAEDAHEAPSLLVNNASAFPQAGLAEATLADVQDAVAVNAWAPLALTRELADRVDEAAVVNLVDARAGDAERSRIPYALSKDVLASATKLLARQLAPDVRVNAVSPGPILPPSEGDTDGFEEIAEATPLGRAGDVEEVADAVAHLLAATYTTGVIVPVDGGQGLTGGVPDG